MRVCLQNRNHLPHPIDFRDVVCDGIYEKDVIYVVHYPVYEDGCIQYADLAFKNELKAQEFAVEHHSGYHKIKVVG